MLDSVSTRSATLAAAEARRPVAADVACAASLRAYPDVAAPDASTTGSVARSLSQSPPVNAGRVAELREALKTGNYPVQAEKLAEAMLASLKA